MTNFIRMRFAGFLIHALLVEALYNGTKKITHRENDRPINVFRKKTVHDSEVMKIRNYNTGEIITNPGEFFIF